MPASTSLSSTCASTDFTSASSVTGLTVMPAFLNTSAATTPQGTWGWHKATLTDFLARLLTDLTFAGLDGGTATSMMFFAKSCGLDASPAVTTWSMFAGAAEANTSAGAPLVICVARPELGPKLNVTLSPGGAASNCFPIWVKVPVSDAAANTVIEAVDAEELAGLAVEAAPPELLLEQPASATAASPAAITVNRRTAELPRFGSRRERDQRISGIRDARPPW